MTDKVEANGESCEKIIRKYGIDDYEIGKTKVSLHKHKNIFVHLIFVFE